MPPLWRSKQPRPLFSILSDMQERMKQEQENTATENEQGAYNSAPTTERSERSSDTELAPSVGPEPSLLRKCRSRGRYKLVPENIDFNLNSQEETDGSSPRGVGAEFHRHKNKIVSVAPSPLGMITSFKIGLLERNGYISTHFCLRVGDNL